MIEIYLGQFSGGWAWEGRTQGWTAHVTPVAGLDRWIAEIEARHASRWRRARVDLWLSGGLARPFVCGPVTGLAGWLEAEAFAASGAGEATGLETPCRVRLEEWPGRAPTVATALDAALAEAIESFAASRRITWRSVRPRWAAALDELLAQRPSAMLFALAEEDALTLLCGTRDVESAVSHLQLASTYAPAPDQVHAQALWHRLMLSQDVQPDGAWFGHLEDGAQADPAVAGAAAAAPAGERRLAWPGVTVGVEGLSS